MYVAPRMSGRPPAAWLRVVILIAYATKKGSVQEVAESIGATLRKHGFEAIVQPARQVKSLDGVDGVILGGSLYMARWHADAHGFLKRHREALRTLPVAVYAMGPLKLEEKDVAGSRAQLDRALRKHRELDPVGVTIFGGVIDPAKLRFPFNRMPAGDARDWDAIRSWALESATRLGARAAQPS
jgi:menaquinone-dependent protoporphyrinogen oxidase